MRSGSTRTIPDARITKMKDGRTHLAHKVEHAVDFSSGAVVAVTVQPADAGDTATILETLPQAQAGEHIAEVACATNNEEVGERVHPEDPVEAVGSLPPRAARDCLGCHRSEQTR